MGRRAADYIKKQMKLKLDKQNKYDTGQLNWDINTHRNPTQGRRKKLWRSEWDIDTSYNST
jgi:hypothetical protein